jgi:hypothetical protein
MSPPAAASLERVWGAVVSVILQLRSVPASLEAVIRDAVESALDGDWAVTLSRSHLDGQWHLRLDGIPAHLRIVLPEESQLSADRLARLLREVTRTHTTTGGA